MNFDQLAKLAMLCENNLSKLYHNTSLKSLLQMFETGKLGVKGFPVSFSRSKHYNVAPGTGDRAEVKIIFLVDKLKQRYRLIPRVGLVASGANSDEVLTGASSRFEAEEVTNKQVPINLYSEILILQSAVDRYKDLIEIDERNLKNFYERLEQLKKGMISVYTSKYKGWAKAADYPKRNIKQEQSAIEEAILQHQTRIATKQQQLENVLKKPGVRIVSNF